MSGCLKQSHTWSGEIQTRKSLLVSCGQLFQLLQGRCLDISSDFHLQIFQHLHLVCSAKESDKTQDSEISRGPENEKPLPPSVRQVQVPSPLLARGAVRTSSFFAGQQELAGELTMPSIL